MAYPIFLGVVGTLVVIGLMVFFVPKFEGLFTRLRERGELPLPTEWLLAHQRRSWQQWWWAGPGRAGGRRGRRARLRLATEAGRVWHDRMKLKLPVAGPIFLNLAVARFCRVLGTLLKNGVPILKSLEITSDVDRQPRAGRRRFATRRRTSRPASRWPRRWRTAGSFRRPWSR